MGWNQKLALDTGVGVFNVEGPAPELVASIGCTEKGGSTPENNLSKFNRKYGQRTRVWNNNPCFRECISVPLSMKKEGAKMSSGMGDGWGKCFTPLNPFRYS